MNRRLLLVALSCSVLPVSLSAAIAYGADSAETWTYDAKLLEPFWLSKTMEGESVLFVKDGENALPKAPLLFAPTKIISVRSSSGKTTYVEGKDYTWNPDKAEIVLPAGSQIPFKKPQDLRRPAGSQQFRLTRRDGNGEILFGGGHEYHDMQAVVTYEHAPAVWPGKLPSFAGDRLPNTMKRLGAAKPLTIALLGDSISTGCNASGWAKTPPFQPAYFDLLVQHLQKVYGSEITLKNFAVGGTGTGWGLENIGKVISTKPDLVILAFGMNDSAGLPPKDYQATIQRMIDAIHKANAETEVILVATMRGNKDWTALRQEYFPQYRDALSSLCKTGVVLADMTSIWTELLRRKNDWDLTGNGVNHPNDFGHRVYAQVFSALLVAPKAGHP